MFYSKNLKNLKILITVFSLEKGDFQKEFMKVLIVV